MKTLKPQPTIEEIKDVIIKLRWGNKSKVNISKSCY